MRAALDNDAAFEDDDLVYSLQGREPVGDEERSVSFGHGKQVGHERVGGRRLEVLGRLVEQEDREPGKQGAGHRDPLALATREA